MFDNYSTYINSSKKRKGLLVGISFTLISLILTLTFIVPMISVIPGALLEVLSRKLVNSEPYSNVGKITICLLTVLFIITFVGGLFLLKKSLIKYGDVSLRRILAFMVLMYFIVHSLAFYIYWGVALNFASDGQLIFSAVISHPMSSFAFVPIGLIIDFIINRTRKFYYQIPRDEL